MAWTNRSVFLIGGGPSLTGFDFECLRGRGVVVAINDAFRYVPWADACFSIDMLWLRNRATELRTFTGERIAAVPDYFRFQPQLPFLTKYRRVSRVGFNRTNIYTGDNSGYAALHLALMRNAARVALLGFDMNKPGHWHKGYEWISPDPQFRVWAANFSVLALQAMRQGTRVINCNPASAVTAFPFADWQEIAEGPAA